MIRFPVIIQTNASIHVNGIGDERVLDLSRGIQSAIGKKFDNRDELLKHLAFCLIVFDLELSQIDGWADLPDDAVSVDIEHIVVDIE